MAPARVAWAWPGRAGRSGRRQPLGRGASRARSRRPDGRRAGGFPRSPARSGGDRIRGARLGHHRGASISSPVRRSRTAASRARSVAEVGQNDLSQVAGQARGAAAARRRSHGSAVAKSRPTSRDRRHCCALLARCPAAGVGDYRGFKSKPVQLRYSTLVCGSSRMRLLFQAPTGASPALSHHPKVPVNSGPLH